MVAVDVEGGYDSTDTQYEFEDENSVVVLPEWTRFTLPDDKLPGMVTVLFLSPLISFREPLKLLLELSKLVRSL